ncbi:uncharacterized mitochondrial protein AtMg00860-like [Capsicum annuum]|uniref:uncharacterized mitochondrial protein AtMg00860-like n=1 Tax=Capsicum annuum TaxID=4072 RepID=UPI001FB0CC6E|nr:uncharacterized mitochondrial protein AtMg00860-like [Capsicum annuum]
MDPKKVQAIADWQAPSGIKELRSFLGLSNYYRKFIAGYSKKAAALTDLPKKDVKWVWSEKCTAFHTLKDAIDSEPILRLPNFELPIVEILASIWAIKAPIISFPKGWEVVPSVSLENVPTKCKKQQAH